MRITFFDRLLEDIQDAKLQLMNEIDAIDFWKQMRIAHVSRLFEDIQDVKLQFIIIFFSLYLPRFRELGVDSRLCKDQNQHMGPAYMHTNFMT